MTYPKPNTDESFNPQPPLDEAYFIGNFHKTLPHDKFGEVNVDAYREFERVCMAIESGMPINFESVLKGSFNAPNPEFHNNADTRFTNSIAKFTSPLAGAASEELGPDPKDLDMPPAPGIRSLSTAAEMVELYWMALLRDEPLDNFNSSNPKINAAITDLQNSLSTALAEDDNEGALKLGQDLPVKNGNLDLNIQTLFRSGLQDEEYGPLVSQFFLHDIPYGVQTIDQRQTPYLMGVDFLTNHHDWLLAQNTGKDKWGRDYGNCNNYADQSSNPVRENYYPTNVKRHISTMRDLARFVNRDALHQAYFNAALFLDAIGAPLDDGNPYKGARHSREAGFASLGGPDLLTVVSEVASRALKVVWRQKWLVHRRARPEVYGGLLQMQFNGLNGATRNYGLPDTVINSEAGSRILASNAAVNALNEETFFLPMAFSAGSPAHPAYGAGHATVAGACVTVLKAWFDETKPLQEILAEAQMPKNRKEPGILHNLHKPGSHVSGESFNAPGDYTGSDAAKMTVGGELNKIASNVAMGRSMGGVHWRSDNTRSLRLGEQVAIEILRKRTLQYAERPVSFTFRAFDRQMVQISQGQVRFF